MSTIGMERHEPPTFEYQDHDDADGPSFWWRNPYNGRREKIASLFWPTHPVEATEAVEHLFENLTLQYRPEVCDHRCLNHDTVPPKCDDCGVLIALDAGKVPDRECFWLVERNTAPPQYVSDNSAGWHEDVWQAIRFNTERQAHDYWRMMGESHRPEFKVVEHMFLNKTAS